MSSEIKTNNAPGLRDVGARTEKFKLRDDITQKERFKLIRILERIDYPIARISKNMMFPADFITFAFLRCIEGFSSLEDLARVDFFDLNLGALKVYNQIVEGKSLEKKS